MAKLWDKGYKLDELIERFTVGNDFILDKALIYYDCIGSIAHAQMLLKCGILKNCEFGKLKEALKAIIAQKDSFIIKQEDEDVHTAVEGYLTAQLGDLGKKIHTARSRNDQVMLDLRLFMRDKLFDLVEDMLLLCTTLIQAAKMGKDIPIPGRTHFQKAMPSSVGLLFGAYTQAILDDIELLHGAYGIINKSPLGSAASYGVLFPLDRQQVADLLGFAQVQNNVLYANNSRGKIESILLSALSQVMVDLSKVSTDFIIFSAPEFGYFELPQELCSGSSLMPQKKNPCALELVRAKSATVISYLTQILTLIRALPSGYNRDFQETKGALMNSFSITHDSVLITTHTIAQLRINKEVCLNAFTPELFATDYALELVQKGIPFRDAYKMVAKNINTIPFQDPLENIQAKVHEGAPGNLGLESLQKQVTDYTSWAQTAKDKYKQCIQKLIED